MWNLTFITVEDFTNHIKSTIEKYGDIRVWRGCSPKEILWLNDVFDIHRNEKTIKLIKEKADGYDMDLKQKADSLMQKKLK